MSRLLHRLMLIFAAGAGGGVANALVVWAFGEWGIAQWLGVQIAPPLTPAMIYHRVTWGGIWGGMFLLLIPRSAWWIRGLVFSLAPTLVQLLVVFPLQVEQGWLGLDLGVMTPLLVVIYNAVWGLVVAGLLHAVLPAQQVKGKQNTPVEHIEETRNLQEAARQTS
jgi:hypothetical protein